ncbi:MAG: hypothetical protein CFE21_08010 [Bacteroidetes bacterium B1(2017)]|nr:MAG: hypothetical protein CFE21_08010 [Bacteroidetes bacterium B1(2017)]
MLRQFMSGKKTLSYFILFFASILCAYANVNTVDSLINLCNHHLDNHENEWAFRVEVELDKQIGNSEINLQYANYLSVKAALASRRKNYTAQEEFLNQYNEVAKKMNSPKLIGTGLIGNASYYEQFGDIKKALPFFLKALDQFKEIQDETQIAYLYNKLGLIYYEDQDYNRAKTYFMASFVLFKKHEKESNLNAYWIQNCLSNIGLCYEQLKLYPKALAYMKIAMAYCQTAPFGRDRPIGVIKTNLGVIYSYLGNYTLALKNLREGIETCLDPKNLEIGHGIESLIYLSNIYTQINRYKEAQDCLDKAKILIYEEKFFSVFDVYYPQLARLSFATQNYKEAYLAQKAFSFYCDSIDKSMEKSTFSGQILLHDLEKQKMENKLLQHENEYRSLQIQVGIGFVILFFIIIGLVYYNLQKSKARNHQLEYLNSQVNVQKTDLEKLNSTLEKINQNKSFLIQSVAHDLRTPIGNVLSLNNLLEEFITTNEEAVEYNKLIDSSCMLALNIIEDILDQSMIERGKLNLKLEPAEIQTLITDTTSLLQFKSKPKSIQIVYKLDTPLLVKIDSDRIKRVLINILVNAIKFSPRNSVILVSQWQDETTCFISISDNGIGMNQDLLNHIFEKNTTSAREGLEKEQTIGIGLSITKSIVEEHGGKIKVESTPNSGSTFYIELPIGTSV